RAGMRANKQNVFDDFAAAGEALVARGWTSPQRLGISGGSNGGLLVGAAMTQRPELFAAVACAVPLLDMLRYQHFLIARFWIDEYGSAEDPTRVRLLRAYSPYHNTRAGTRYPAVLFTTAEGDSRVDPGHARKMTALLQWLQRDEPDAVTLLRGDRDGRHGIGKPLDKQVDDYADQLAFFAWRLGIRSAERVGTVAAGRGTSSDSCASRPRVTTAACAARTTHAPTSASSASSSPPGSFGSPAPNATRPSSCSSWSTRSTRT